MERSNYAVSWDLSKIDPEVLPKEDCAISYKKLNAWQVNASKNDILKWNELAEMADYTAQVPAIHKLVEGATADPATNDPTLFNPAIVSNVMPFFTQSPVKFTFRKQHSNTSAVALIQFEDELIPMTALIMGIKK